MSLIVDQSLDNLRNQYKEKVNALREVLLTLEHLQHTVIPDLRQKYDAKFREFEVKIQELTLQLSEKQRVNELLLLKYQRGEEITEKVVQFVLMFVEKEYTKYKTPNKTSSFGLQESSTTISASSNNVSAELSKLYKDLVKKLHPDSPQKDEKLYEQFWNIVQESYEKQHIQRLRTFHSIVCTQHLSPEMFSSTASEKERLQAEISFLERKLLNEQKKIDSLCSKEPYTYKDRIDETEWIHQQTEQLQTTIEKIYAEILQSKKVFATVTKGVILTNDDSHIADVPSKEYDKNFTDSTYFGGR